MICPEGRVQLYQLRIEVDELVYAGLPDDELLKLYPDIDTSQKYWGNRVKTRLSQVIFRRLIDNTRSLAITSPKGVTLLAGSQFLEAHSYGKDHPVSQELGYSANDSVYDYLFVEPGMFFVSRRAWDNGIGEIFRKHAGEDYLHYAAIAEHISNFEGWFLSIDQKDDPQTYSDLGHYMHGILQKQVDEEIVGLTQRTLRKLLESNPAITKTEARGQFPEAGTRRFNFVWSSLAETYPEMSKPGRKKEAMD